MNPDSIFGGWYARHLNKYQGNKDRYMKIDNLYRESKNIIKDVDNLYNNDCPQCIKEYLQQNFVNTFDRTKDVLNYKKFSPIDYD